MQITAVPQAVWEGADGNPLVDKGRSPMVMFGAAHERGRAFIAVLARDPAFDVRRLTPARIAQWACLPTREWTTMADDWPAVRRGETRWRKPVNLEGICIGPTPDAVAPDDDLMLVFAYPRGQEPLQALYEIEEAEQGLPPALATGLLAATQAAAQTRYMAGFIGSVAGSAGGLGLANVPRCNRQQITERVEQAVTQLAADLDVPLPTPPRAVDAARFWLALARRLWEPVTRLRLARSLPTLAEVEPVPAVRQATLLALAWLALHDRPEVSVAGVSLALPAATELGLLTWPQVLELDAGGIPAAALRFLLGDTLPAHTRQDVQRQQALAVQPYDGALAQGISATLLAEATAHPAYAPEGSFYLELPAEYPLAGVTRRLRVWLAPDHLWCGLEGESGVFGVVQWRPGQPLARRAFGGRLADLLEPTLAALWHDLRVAGPQALTELAPARQLPRGPATVPALTTVTAPLLPRGRTLPAPRRLVLGGRQAWGTTEERAAICRQAHGVRGHLRRLLAGAHVGVAATRCAQRYGLAVPEGFTFVRPHVRGGQAVDNGVAPTPIRARGLATIMTLLHPAERTDGR